MRLGKTFRGWNKWSSCRFGEYGNSSLAALLSLSSPVTKGTELTLKLLIFLWFFPLPFSGLAVGPWRCQLWIFCYLFLCLICGSASPAAPRAGLWEGRGEGAGWDLRVPGIPHLPFGQNVCAAIQCCALGDHITLKSFSGLLIHRNSVNSGNSTNWSFGVQFCLM